MNHMRRAVLLFAFGLCIMAATHPAFGGSTLVPGASTGHEASIERQRPILRALARMGVKASGAAFAPVVFAKLTRAQIYAMARRPDVGKIYGPERNTLF